MDGDETNGAPITLAELELKLYHPRPSNRSLFAATLPDKEYTAEPSSISYVPWKIYQTQRRRDQVCEQSSSGEQDPLHPSSVPLPSYLDLRRQQNRAWANNRLVKGNEQFYMDPVKADKFYQEGIDLVPDHVELLVAQSKLWYQRRYRPQAAKAQLQECLRMDPNNKEAKEHYDRLVRQENARRTVAPKRLPQARETSAYQDVLMERNLALDNSLLGEEETVSGKESATSSRRQKESKRKKKKKKDKSKKKSSRRKRRDKKRRHKRRRYDSSEDDETSSNSEGSSGDDSYGSESNHAGSYKGKKFEKRKRHHRRHDSDASSGSLSETSASQSAVTGNIPRNEARIHSKDDSEKESMRSSRRHRRKRSDRKYSKQKRRRKKGSPGPQPSSPIQEASPGVKKDLSFGV